MNDKQTMINRKILFLINPVAGKGEAMALITRIREEFDEIPHEILISKEEGQISSLVKNEMERGYTDVIAVGGDGTLAEVINGVAERRISVGIIPTGSGNDFLKTLNLSENIKESMDRIKMGITDQLYLPKVNDHYFINVLGWGVDSEIIKEKNKNIIRDGKLNYLYSTLKMLMVYRPKEVKLTIDDREVLRTTYITAIANGKYVGNGMKICPDASPYKKEFQICTVSKMSRLKLLWNFRKIFKGTHGSVPEIEFFQGKDIRVEFQKDTVIQEDGNLLTVKELRIKKESTINFLR